MKKSLFHTLGGALIAAVVFMLALVVLAIVPATTVPNLKAARAVVLQAAVDTGVFFRQVVASYAIRVAPWSQAFQSAIASNLGFGVVGEIIFDGPSRVQPGVVKGTAANIVVGRAFTRDPADGQFSPGGGGLVFGGILCNPKALASYGTSAGGPLAPTLTVPAGTVCEFMTMGYLCVALSTAAVVGGGVFYDDVTGVLGSGVAGVGQTQIAGAAVVRYANAAAGLAVISLTGA